MKPNKKQFFFEIPSDTLGDTLWLVFYHEGSQRISQRHTKYLTLAYPLKRWAE